MIDQLKTLLGWRSAGMFEGFHIYEAAPNSKFWDLWRNQKQACRDAGVSVAKRGGDWIVEIKLGQPLEGVTAQAPEVVLAPVAEVGTLDLSIPWSDEQKAIFAHFEKGEGNLVVRARAGTGKTTTIKAAFSVAPEAKMLYAVFNKKNQKEAAEKITDSRVEVKTLHSLGFAYILRVWKGVKPDDNVEWDRIDAVAGRNIADEVRGALKKLVGFAKNLSVNPSIDELVEICEDRQIDAEGFEDEKDGGWNLEKLSEYAIKVLEISKQRDPMNRISFNDMVWLPVAMDWVRPWYDLACVDETQDMNMLQLEMVIGCCRGRIIVVGDDRQAIYGFRGAASNGLDIMKSRLNAKELGLTLTHRCPKSVVKLASEYVADYRVADDAPEGIVRDVPAIKAADVRPGDAILSRLNAPLMPQCLSLLRQGVPARIEGRDIGKMLLGIVEKMKAKSVPDFCKKIVAHGERQIARVKASKNSEAKIEAIQDTTATLLAMAEGVSNVAEIKSRCISLFNDSDNNPRPAVVLSSTHKAKGLEWDKVFILTGTYLKRQDLEEKNIYYVAITRAKKELVFVADEEKE